MIDLHAHTTYSDGTFTPRELVALAARTGLNAVAITDHDSVDGLAEGAAAGAELGVQVVPGVEINLEHDRLTVDLLGYFLGGPPGDRVGATLAELRGYRDVRNAQILERLRELGYPVEPDELAAIAGSGAAVGRPHIGEAMRRRGYVGSITEAFERFLRRGAPAWVDRRRLSLSAAARLVRRAGGLPVVAHPGIVRTDEAGLDHLVAAAARCGVSGLECYYPSHDEAMVRRCLALAATYDLVPTGGSDFHGQTKPGVVLGRADGDRPVPDSVLDELTARWEREQAARQAGAPEPGC